jgi:hypothetical protein
MTPVVVKPHPPNLQVWIVCAQFEENLISYKMQQAAEDEDEEEPQANGAGDDGADFLLKDDENDLDLRCACIKPSPRTHPHISGVLRCQRGRMLLVSMRLRSTSKGCVTMASSSLAYLPSTLHQVWVLSLLCLPATPVGLGTIEESLVRKLVGHLVASSQFFGRHLHMHGRR